MSKVLPETSSNDHDHLPSVPATEAAGVDEAAASGCRQSAASWHARYQEALRSRALRLVRCWQRSSRRAARSRIGVLYLTQRRRTRHTWHKHRAALTRWLLRLLCLATTAADGLVAYSVVTELQRHAQARQYPPADQLTAAQRATYFLTAVAACGFALAPYLWLWAGVLPLAAARYRDLFVPLSSLALMRCQKKKAIHHHVEMPKGLAAEGKLSAAEAKEKERADAEEIRQVRGDAPTGCCEGCEITLCGCTADGRTFAALRHVTFALLYGLLGVPALVLADATLAVRKRGDALFRSSHWLWYEQLRQPLGLIFQSLPLLGLHFYLFTQAATPSHRYVVDYEWPAATTGVAPDLNESYAVLITGRAWPAPRAAFNASGTLDAARNPGALRSAPGQYGVHSDPKVLAYDFGVAPDVYAGAGAAAAAAAAAAAGAGGAAGLAEVPMPRAAAGGAGHADAGDSVWSYLQLVRPLRVNVLLVLVALGLAGASALVLLRTLLARGLGRGLGGYADEHRHDPLCVRWYHHARRWTRGLVFGVWASLHPLLFSPDGATRLAHPEEALRRGALHPPFALYNGMSGLGDAEHGLHDVREMCAALQAPRCVASLKVLSLRGCHIGNSPAAAAALGAALQALLAPGASCNYIDLTDNRLTDACKRTIGSAAMAAAKLLHARAEMVERNAEAERVRLGAAYAPPAFGALTTFLTNEWEVRPPSAAQRRAARQRRRAAEKRLAHARARGRGGGAAATAAAAAAAKGGAADKVRFGLQLASSALRPGDAVLIAGVLAALPAANRAQLAEALPPEEEEAEEEGKQLLLEAEGGDQQQSRGGGDDDDDDDDSSSSDDEESHAFDDDTSTELSALVLSDNPLCGASWVHEQQKVEGEYDFGGIQALAQWLTIAGARCSLRRLELADVALGGWNGFHSFGHGNMEDYDGGGTEALLPALQANGSIEQLDIGGNRLRPSVCTDAINALIHVSGGAGSGAAEDEAGDMNKFRHWRRWRRAKLALRLAENPLVQYHGTAGGGWDLRAVAALLAALKTLSMPGERFEATREAAALTAAARAGKPAVVDKWEACKDPKTGRRFYRCVSKGGPTPFDASRWTMPPAAHPLTLASLDVRLATIVGEEKQQLQELCELKGVTLHI